MGAQVNLGNNPAGGKPGVAPIEGSEKHQ